MMHRWRPLRAPAEEFGARPAGPDGELRALGRLAGKLPPIPWGSDKDVPELAPQRSSARWRAQAPSSGKLPELLTGHRVVVFWSTGHVRDARRTIPPVNPLVTKCGSPVPFQTYARWLVADKRIRA